MTGEETRYEVTEIKAIRGTEARTITKKQQEGWELVTQQQGSLRTTMTFRRPKPAIPWRLWAALGGAGVILAGIITVVALLAGGSEESTTDTVAVSSAELPAPPPTPEREAEPATPEIAEILTIDNNEDLARILHDTDDCGQSVSDFATQYAGRTIQFDGHIGAINNHGTYKTRYDILINARDFDESNPSGPNFQFRDVNLVSDIKLTGSDLPDTLGVHDTLRVTAVVDRMLPRTCLLKLDPVSTEIR